MTGLGTSGTVHCWKLLPGTETWDGLLTHHQTCYMLAQNICDPSSSQTLLQGLRAEITPGRVGGGAVWGVRD